VVIARLHVESWRETYKGMIPPVSRTSILPTALRAGLPESIYLFENLPELARFA
jgi:hypothetical protein